jgi:putative PIN family toxin of toxin-antitoxin system
MKTYVLDTDVVVEALCNPGGPSAEYLRSARRREIRLTANIGLALEYQALCESEDAQARAGLSSQDADLFATGLIAMLDPVETHRLWSPRLRDPTDEMVLEAAVNGQADAIVTFHPRDFAVASDRFGIEVMKPGRR